MTASTAPFIAHLANALFIGEERLDLGQGAWVRGLIRLSLDGHQVELKQQPWVIGEGSWSELQGQWKHTTDLHVLEIPESERDQAILLAKSMAELLGFATASEVVVAGWDHAVGSSTALRWSTMGGINHFIPVIDTRDGAGVRRFLELVWDGYSREEKRRNLPAVFHYLALAEREGTPIELKLAILFIILEQLKHSFAVNHGYVFIKPWFHVPGTVRPTRASSRGFDKLLLEMFGSVGMSLSMSAVTNLRNEILHSGLSARPFNELMHLEDEILALIREYILRLIDYTGAFLTGQSGGVRAVIK